MMKMEKKCSYCYGLGYTGLVAEKGKITKAICPKCKGRGKIEIFSQGHDVDEFYRE